MRILTIIIALLSLAAQAQPHRPQLHFSPPAHWMNDPNGLVFYKGTYQLFYQYYPDSNVWGPMHWGHATSTDLVHWQHQPIALYPDSLGYIFSGSAVVDADNTSGFGRNGKVPLVAMFTHHDPAGEKAGRNDFQVQSLAYSLDEGKTWTKYRGNPVLRNPGIKDFRDPKLRWYPETKQWILTLATLDRISFYTSPDLKHWTKGSEFGQTMGAHGGVWECPDLFPMTLAGKTVWILIVNINPGGPNGGSGTQYFVGDFDGRHFTPFDTDIRWLDWGPDEYAGVTYSNTGNRHLFLGWMSNWAYAQQVPTQIWRSALTVPRNLYLDKVNGRYYVRSQPVPELTRQETIVHHFQNLGLASFRITEKTGPLKGPARMVLNTDQLHSFSLTLSNDLGQKLMLGYDEKRKEYYIDRSASGKVDFEKSFADRVAAPRVSLQPGSEITVIIDVASVELFADKGLTVMTAIFFPDKDFTDVQLNSSTRWRTLNFSHLKSMH